MPEPHLPQLRQGAQRRDRDELVDLGLDHAGEHGHTQPLPRERVLARIRRHNPSTGGSPGR